MDAAVGLEPVGRLAAAEVQQAAVLGVDAVQKAAVERGFVGAAGQLVPARGGEDPPRARRHVDARHEGAERARAPRHGFRAQRDKDGDEGEHERPGEAGVGEVEDVVVDELAGDPDDLAHQRRGCGILHHADVVAREIAAELGVTEDMIPSAFNCFMNVPVDGETGKLRVLPPISKAGDKIVFRAAMDLVIGLTACSALQSNNGSFKPIDYEILPAR